jgi:hypothetical protein
MRTVSSPLGRRVSPTAVWTGSELVVWGGDDGSGSNVVFSGARYDPQRDAWTTMSQTVLQGSPVSAVWAKDRVVFAGSEIATYEPASDKWSGYRSGLLEKNAPLLTYTGDEVVGWFYEIPARPGLRIDPVTTQITQDIPAPPMTIGYDATPVWTGYEWMIFPASGRNGIAFDPRANRWRTLPAAPVEFVSHGLATWSGSEVIVYGRSALHSRLLTGAAYDPGTNSWTLLPAIPVPISVLSDLPWGDDGPHLVWSDDRAVLLTGSADPDLALFVIDPHMTRAQPVSRLPFAPESRTPLISSGTAVYFLLTSGDLAEITIR